MLTSGLGSSEWRPEPDGVISERITYVPKWKSSEEPVSGSPHFSTKEEQQDYIITYQVRDTFKKVLHTYQMPIWDFLNFTASKKKSYESSVLHTCWPSSTILHIFFKNLHVPFSARVAMLLRYVVNTKGGREGHISSSESSSALLSVLSIEAPQGQQPIKGKGMTHCYDR